MKASILVVSRNRKEELAKTIEILQKYTNPSLHEIRIFLDGCTDGSEELLELFPNVQWQISVENVGPSKARNILFRKAKGKILYGFDDDAHPLQKNFIKLTETLFEERPTVGIVGFREVKGVFKNDQSIPPDLLAPRQDYITNEFLGCGFAVRKDVYNKTRGFPSWIDIYGEEACLSWETILAGYDILFTHRILVNHRVNKEKRKQSGANYFRFRKQLKNTTYFYLVYYPFPLLIHRILRLYYKNLIKYAIKDRNFFRGFLESIAEVMLNSYRILKYRRPVSRIDIEKIRCLRNPEY